MCAFEKWKIIIEQLFLRNVFLNNIERRAVSLRQLSFLLDMSTSVPDTSGRLVQGFQHVTKQLNN